MSACIVDSVGNRSPGRTLTSVVCHPGTAVDTSTRSSVAARKDPNTMRCPLCARRLETDGNVHCMHFE